MTRAETLQALEDHILVMEPKALTQGPIDFGIITPAQFNFLFLSWRDSSCFYPRCNVSNSKGTEKALTRKGYIVDGELTSEAADQLNELFAWDN